MTGPGGRWVRGLRAAVATLVVIGLGASAHAMGGGSPLPPLAAVVLLVLVGPLVWLVLRARTSVPRMVLATGGGQVVTHLALVAMAPSTGGTAGTQHVHDAVAVTAGGSSAGMAMHVTGPMVLAHVLATVLASLLLTIGDDVVRAAVRRLAAVLRPVLVPVELRLAPVSHPARGLTGRGVRPLGGRAPPLRTC